jgi:rhamnogalacturonyl hydrolase YesR
MAPPLLAELSQITNRQNYLDYMDRQWWKTSAGLYDQQQHLFYRDARFINRHEANGNSIFWSRGNGWVLAGLVRVLLAMPKDYPSRPKYVTQFKQMAAEVITVQGADGLWSAGLLDATAHPMAETSGTSLITYALAYGINEGILDRKQYQPHVISAWHGLVAHIYSDGRLGAVQPVGDSPGTLKPTSSYVYGVGAFLLAGSEIYALAKF